MEIETEVLERYPSVLENMARRKIGDLVKGQMKPRLMERSEHKSDG